MRVEHYAQGAMETVSKQELVGEELERALNPMKIHYLLTALKYFDRMGLKGDPQKDAYKCADYLHRAITGEWLDDEEVTGGVV